MLGITNSLSQGRPLWWKGLLIGPGKMRLNFSSTSVSPGPIEMTSPAAISQEIRILVQFGSSHVPSPCLTHTSYKIPMPISLSSERYFDTLLLSNREGNVHTLCTPTIPFTPALPLHPQEMQSVLFRVQIAIPNQEETPGRVRALVVQDN